MSKINIVTLHNETGIPLNTCKKALELCKNYDEAKEFLHLTHTAVARYKIVNGKKIMFTDEDYLNLIRKTN